MYMFLLLCATIDKQFDIFYFLLLTILSIKNGAGTLALALLFMDLGMREKLFEITQYLCLCVSASLSHFLSSHFSLSYSTTLFLPPNVSLFT